ncbi:hypothetical protein AGABI2DRAFT_196303 [Agaricus bisporus var. bisporus H97]|uniref:hypothetical protein n=1 Tax=Agaricus bisporus var. bisporus (strain H97 / ATCC MYA-4626 / FGSC 10389) TaxID=936046 RepID=UPI00029F8055|nr:hypothetical protein AGABI2DRAFT_196303 [Agaricus bisporus var. bisporus H97]EKV50784.1 hypothetical protein AGABI2DRAFT_196303 [Agaricus bisporus var. bisporus H97]
MSSSDLVHIADQLSSILTQMSSIKSRFICSVKNQALRNFFYPSSFEPKHPFSNSFFHLLPRNDAIHFVHGDLVPPNIMVEDSTITGIIDWASGGFYPSHWEYCRMWQYTSGNWVYILERVFPGRPRRMEIEAHRKLISMLANNF